MKQTFLVSGMTCQGCVSSVRESLSVLKGVDSVMVNLERGEVEVTASGPLTTSVLQSALPPKYGIGKKGGSKELGEVPREKTKLQQLKPLFLIFAYLFAAAFLLNLQPWNVASAMLDFMGLFYIVFSFFKFLDLKGFPASFRMYDPLAKAIPLYGWVYPFLELAMGLLFLMRIGVRFALVATIIVLGITTFGVVKSLLQKRAIRCACLGTALNLPMTEATFIENSMMLVMAVVMLWFGWS